MIQASHDVGGGRPASGPESAGPIHSTFQDDPEMRAILAAFAAEMPDRMSQFRRAFDAGDPRRLRSLAHQLKGAAGGYGYPAVGAAAADLEACLGAAPEDRAGCGERLDRLLGLLARVGRSG